MRWEKLDKKKEEEKKKEKRNNQKKKIRIYEAEDADPLFFSDILGAPEDRKWNFYYGHSGFQNADPRQS